MTRARWASAAASPKRGSLGLAPGRRPLRCAPTHKTHLVSARARPPRRLRLLALSRRPVQARRRRLLLRPYPHRRPFPLPFWSAVAFQKGEDRAAAGRRSRQTRRRWASVVLVRGSLQTRAASSSMDFFAIRKTSERRWRIEQSKSDFDGPVHESIGAIHLMEMGPCPFLSANWTKCASEISQTGNWVSHWLSSS